MSKIKILSSIVGHLVLIVILTVITALTPIKASESPQDGYKVDHHVGREGRGEIIPVERNPSDLVQPKPPSDAQHHHHHTWRQPCDQECRKDCHSPPHNRHQNEKLPPWKISRQKYYHQPSQNPLQKALRFLERDCSPTVGYQSVISNSTKFRHLMLPALEIYSSAIVLGLVHTIPGLSPIIPKILLHFLKQQRQRSGLSNFFVDRTIIPNDVEDSSIVLSVLLELGQVKSNVARKAAQIILENTNDKGVITEYIEPFNRPEIKGLMGPGPLSNVLRLLSALKMEEEAEKTMDFLHHWLDSKAANGHSLYYEPDAVIYFLSNSVPLSKNVGKTFSKLLSKKLMDRFGRTKNPLDISMRILAAHNLQMFSSPSSSSFKNNNKRHCHVKFSNKIVKNKITCEFNRLLTLQRWDGSWGMSSITTSDDGTIHYGSEAVTTAYAAKAIHLLAHPGGGRPSWSKL